MSIEALATRAKYLQEEVNKASSAVNELSQKLQQQTLQMHVLSGHLNEVAYLLSEAQKGEEQNGETDVEVEEQVA